MLSIGTYVCNSCACSGISSLGSSIDAVDAMWTFCKQELGGEGGAFAPRGSFPTLNPWYVWVAGPEVPRESSGGSHHSKKWTCYGTEFAVYIVENGLGVVSTAGQRLNLRHHRETTCQVWIWGPDQLAMEIWYTKEKARRDKLPKPKLPAPPPAPFKGHWDKVCGVAGWACPHCNQKLVLDAPLWVEGGGYYCEVFGKERELKLG